MYQEHVKNIKSNGWLRLVIIPFFTYLIPSLLQPIIGFYWVVEIQKSDLLQAQYP